MKKILLFATAFVFSIAVMAQTETKQKTPKTTTKVTTTTPLKVVEPVKPQTTGEVKPQTVTQTTTDQGPSPDEVMKVNMLKYDFGKIKQGVPVNYSFEIKNISSKHLVVENATASCGCTTPEWSREPIAPGATARIKVGYNAANPGSFTKDIHIKLAGITQDKVVQITGEVLVPEPPKTNN